MVRTTAYQQKIAQLFNQQVRARTFKEVKQVLRRVFQNTKEAGANILQRIGKDHT